MSDQGIFPRQGVPDDAGHHNALDFMMRQRLAYLRTAMPVKVIAVHGGGLDGYPTVDVQICVNQVDGVGTQKEHGTIYGIPCTRSHGGANAIINDPKVGDVGIMSMADRDISALKANNGEISNPGSRRMHDLADGIYHGTMFQLEAPGQYIQFTEDGIVIQSGAGKVTINGLTIDPDGNVETPGNVTAGHGTGDSVTLQTHLHSGITPGGANTQSPVPGT
jgi:hypothetical protein